MTEPHDDEAVELQASTGNYASDRHLLLKEVKLLAKEVGRLRGDTKYLGEVVVPREEMAHRRKIMIALVVVGFLALALPLALFYVSEQRDEAEDRAFAARVLEFERETVKACETRNRALDNDAEFAADLIELFETISADNPRAEEYLATLREYQQGLGEKADCMRRAQLIEARAVAG